MLLPASIACLILRMRWPVRPTYVIRLGEKPRLTPVFRRMDMGLRKAYLADPESRVVIVIPASASRALQDAYRKKGRCAVIDESSNRLVRQFWNTVSILLAGSLEPPSGIDIRMAWSLPPRVSLKRQLAQVRVLEQRIVPDQTKKTVVVAVRESSYYKDLLSRGLKIPAEDATSPRNVGIRNYLSMMNSFAEMDYYVVRMGIRVDEQLADSMHPNVIDYATQHRTELGDLAMINRAQFVVVGACGVWALAAALGKPFLVTDDYAVEGLHMWPPSSLVLPRRIWSASLGRPLTFLETRQFRPNVVEAIESNQFDLRYVACSSSEILRACEEMRERVMGQWVETPNDLRNQQIFVDQYSSTYGNTCVPVPLCSSFLRSNPDFLSAT